MLTVENVEVVYNDVILVLRGVSVEVGDSEIVALLGANGAGKTTLLRAISGLLKTHRGVVTKGRIALGDDDLAHRDPAAIVRSGVSQVMEGRRIFPTLSVEDNLRAGAATAARADASDAQARVFDLFPILKERRKQSGGYLSGGEQQMLAIGRALMTDPKLLLMDEPSLGLAPRVQAQIRDIIVGINEAGTSVLLVEQNANMALSIASRGYVMEVGRVVLDDTAANLRDNDDVKEFYLGLSAEGAKKSFRDVKRYKRKKRWLS